MHLGNIECRLEVFQFTVYNIAGRKLSECICLPNELKQEIKKKTGGTKQGAKQKSGRPWPTQAPP